LPPSQGVGTGAEMHRVQALAHSAPMATMQAAAAQLPSWQFPVLQSAGSKQALEDCASTLASTA